MRSTDDGSRALDRQGLADEREGLREQLFNLLDPIMTALGLVTAIILVVEFVAELSPQQAAWIDRAQLAIWAIFTVEFAVQFGLAPRKLHFLRSHWLAAIAVVLPAFRVMRLLRAARALRSLRLVRLIGGTNRAMNALRAMLRGRQFGYLVAATLLVGVLGTAGILVFERDQPDANILTAGDALWWASCMITTINNEKYAVSPEGRVLAVLLRVYAAAIFGLVTANIASYFVGRRREEAAEGTAAPWAVEPAIAEEVRQMREEMRGLRQSLDAAASRVRPEGHGIGPRGQQAGDAAGAAPPTE